MCLDTLRIALTASIAAATFSVAASSFADTVTLSAGGSNAVAIDTANGTPASTIQLSAASSTVSVPGSFTQGLTFTSGYDGVAGPVPFTVSENITLNSLTETVNLQGVMTVSPTTDPDSIEISTSMAPIQFGNYTLSAVSQTFLDNPPFPGGVLNTTQSFNVQPVPVPAALPLLLSGLGGIGVFLRRRSTRSTR